MPRLMKKRSKKAGLTPGTLVHIGERKAETAQIHVIDYDWNRLQELDCGQIEECFPFKETATVTWINIDGLHDTQLLAKLGNYFSIHPLVLEDILNTDQRPKMEDFDSYVYIVFKMLFYNDESRKVEAEQFSLILGANFILSFQEKPGDVLNPVREHLRNGKGRLRQAGTDYLAYALVDAVVDYYFIILEKLGDEIESVEEALLARPAPDTPHRIHELKREMVYLRKSLWPLRELLSGLLRGESSLITALSKTYLRDVYDHTIQIVDTVEAYRDVLSGLLDIYLSSISNRMNEIMKALTLVATIFIPLTFIAGVYGMNFRNMPELEWYWGYPLAWLVMLLLAGSMYCFFKRKRWV